MLLIYYYVLSLIHYFDQSEIHRIFVNLICVFLFSWKWYWKSFKIIFSCLSCQMIFFKIWWQHCALNVHLSFYDTVVLLSRIKNNSLHILVEICQTIHLMYMLAKNVFYDSTKVFFVWSSFLIIRLLAVLLFVFMLIVLEMHLGFVIIVF